MEKAFTHSLPRRNRLKQKRLIDQLFESGQSCRQHPVLAVYGEFDDAFQVGFSVSKRRIRSAVVRNRIRRRLREALRLHKADWCADLAGFKVMFIYLPHTEWEYAAIARAVSRILQALHKEKADRDKGHEKAPPP